MKILIVDDEYYTVEMLSREIDWNIFGITEVIKAYNGKEALEKILKEKPDIVICDIEMPQFDGLTVLQKAKQQIPDIHFIILTGFEKFEYVKEAIHYGACEYLTKPFEMQDVAATVIKAAGEITQKRAAKQKEQYWEKNKRMVRQETLKRILQKDIPSTPEDIRRILEEQGLEYDPGKKRRMVLAIFTNLEEFPPEDQELYQFFFQNIVSEILCGNLYSSEMLVIPIENFYAITAFLDGEGMWENTARQRCKKLVEAGRKYMRIELNCIVGNTVGVADAAQEWKRLKAIAAENVLQPGQILPDWKERDLGQISESFFDMEYFIKCLEEQDDGKMIRFISNTLENMQEQGKVTPGLLTRLQADIMQEIYSFLKKRGIQAHLLYCNEQVAKMQERAKKSPFHMTRWVELLCREAFAEIDKLKNKSGVINDVEVYIRKHFRENITRTEIAEHVYLTPNYLSRLFHDEKGISIPEYINVLRIEAAKELILSTDLTMGSIAMEVGFESMAYFSTIFKKVCGYSPVQWNSIQKK